MKRLVCTILGVLLTQLLFGQNDNAHLLVQSPNGKKVMLVWFLKTWNSDITGFDIKRKEGLQDWVKLNTEPIIPGISMKKKLSIVDADKNEVNKLEARLYKLLATHKLKETETASYLQKLITDEKVLHELSDVMAHDYELALMNGFAYIDRTVTKKTDYQYGLFIQGTDKLLARASWNYGEIPDLNTIQEITSKATIKSNGVQIIWDADMNKMKAADVAGFNIYRQGIRLNTKPITAADSKDLSEFTWYDKSAYSTEPIQYSISAASIFGIEGIIKPYTYDPADHPTTYKKPVVTEIASLGYYFKDGISVKWEFPKEDERFLKGFYVEKNSLPAGYTKASSLLEPSARMFIDKTPTGVSSYISFRVIAVYNDRTLFPGVDRLYSYFLVTEPPAPQHIKARLEATNKKNVVHLSWDPLMNGDAVTDHYKIYVSGPADDKFSMANENRPVKANNFNYGVSEGSTGVYKFYVSAIGKSTAESIPSDTVAIDVPAIPK